MKRAEKFVDAKVSHIAFNNGSLVFQFVKSKGHQNGEDYVGTWHVYANFCGPFFYLCWYYHGIIYIPRAIGKQDFSIPRQILV